MRSGEGGSSCKRGRDDQSSERQTQSTTSLYLVRRICQSLLLFFHISCGHSSALGANASASSEWRSLLVDQPCGIVSSVFPLPNSPFQARQSESRQGLTCVGTLSRQNRYRPRLSCVQKDEDLRLDRSLRTAQHANEWGSSAVRICKGVLIDGLKAPVTVELCLIRQRYPQWLLRTFASLSVNKVNAASS